MTYSVEPWFSNQNFLEGLLKQFLILVDLGWEYLHGNKVPAGACAAGPEMAL